MMTIEELLKILRKYDENAVINFVNRSGTTILVDNIEEYVKEDGSIEPVIVLRA